MLLETYISNPQNIMHKPKKSLRVRQITEWHSAGFSPHVGPHVRTRQCEHSLFIHVWTFGAGPQCGTRSADPHARTRQSECTFTYSVMSLNIWYCENVDACYGTGGNNQYRNLQADIYFEAIHFSYCT